MKLIEVSRGISIETFDSTTGLKTWHKYGVKSALDEYDNEHEAMDKCKKFLIDTFKRENPSVTITNINEEIPTIQVKEQ